MAKTASPNPLIPFATKTLNIDNEFFTYKSIHGTVYYGTIENTGFYFGDDAFMVLIKNQNIKKTDHFEAEDGLKQYKIKYENGIFFNGGSKLIGKKTEMSANVNKLIKQYLDIDGIPVKERGIEDIKARLIKDGMYLCQEYEDVFEKYIDDKTTLEFINTLAENYDNNVIKLQNDSVMVVAALGGSVGNNDGFFYSPEISQVLDILPGRIFRVGLDYKGRLSFFTNNTAVILPEIVNEELVANCTDRLDKDTAYCCLLISKKINAVKGACDNLIYSFSTPMESLLDKKNTETPIVKELCYGRAKWQKIDIGKTIKQSGVSFTQVAETEELVGYKNKDGILLIKSK